MNLKDAGIYDLTNIFKGEATIAHASSQGGVINNTPRLINIPAYQRPYRWKTDNIIRLFQDYDENSEEYFLGSAVVVEKKKADGSMEFDVVDGQQRLTTLYLLNYVRYLLRREYTLEKLSKPYQPKASEYCTELKKCYVNLIGKNEAPFNAILSKIEELMENETLDQNERVEQLVLCYKEQLCIPEVKATPQETLEERLRQAHLFFDGEQLCLKYSRARYDTVLRNALCTVYLKNVQDTTSYKLDTILNNDDDQFLANYLDALRTILEEIWKRAKLKVGNDSAGITEICEKAIELADGIIRNMSLCIVLTENENDANKLFEVLNDRALEVEDLELIKNHFYKEYCTKSSDSDGQKDIRITELDELWADKIFCGNGEFRNRLISYLTSVFFTCDKELGYKDDAKLKDAIEKNYSSKIYPVGGKAYTYENILADFNTYYAVKMILDLFEVKAQKLNEVSLKAEQERKSITYKAIHLLNALKYHAVIPALTNVIISAYAKDHSLTDSNFESSFKNYIKGLIEDKEHVKDEYKKIHQCAYMLWVAAIKGKDYVMARSIAKRIITKYGHVGFSDDNMDFQGTEISELDAELDKWLNDWTFSGSKTFAIKILLLNLLLTQRIDVPNAYKASSVTLKVAALVYNLDAGKLQLDHLEANIVNPATPQAYYLSHDSEKRQKDVNGYIGNFMILDATDNNQKNNVPLCNAMQYYSGIKTSWLIEDINSMIADPLYFDVQTNVPREEFFIERSRRLKKYFKAYLGKQLDDKTITIDF
ncbi:MAG: DUF262 domain-containing protein [Butyrivibrio crossotus]|jgi:uncharacterized protein with ParB-like and HNH nuclease domain|nr:DUF262 domain-containing protein [Butyrivibrio crossotus]